MAAAFAVSCPTATIAVRGVDEVSPAQVLVPTFEGDDDATTQPTVSSSQPSSRANFPPPNPPFVFPGRPSSSSIAFSSSRVAGRRPQSAIELPGRTPAFGDGLSNSPSRSPALPDFSFNPAAGFGPGTARRHSKPSVLPDFSFNPGATLRPDNSLLSPPLSPQSPGLSPIRNGHRRGGSEFVGGKPKSGEPITVMTSSPTRSDSGFASPKLSPADIHPRRGHAHRRSGAISSHDLTMILKPTSPAAMRGSSAPTSPVEFDDKFRTFPDSNVETTPSEPSPMEDPQEVLFSATVESSPSPKSAVRTRVGFSDTLEFIPRPLSLISTDTSSTTTVRPGHKVSGSISSVMSSNPAPADRDPSSRVGSPVPRAQNESRPSTAGAVLERTLSLQVLDGNSESSRRRNSIPLLIGLPQSRSGSPINTSPAKTPRKWSFFGLDPFASAGSPTKAKPVGSCPPRDSEEALSLENAFADQEDGPKMNGGMSRTDSKKSSGRKKKQKKVKSWAGSILTRKSKSRSQKSKPVRRRSQTPPMRQGLPVDEVEQGPLDISGPPTTPMVLVTAPVPSDSAPSTPSRIYDEDIHYPMIDLDAALGPFNTPSSRDPQWDEAQRAGATPKRQLHSAAGMRGFSGPGMHYHRRAESAPEMPPFEAARFGIHRFGSSSTMADVFEEDEEDDELDQSATAPSEESTADTRDDSSVEVDSASNSDDGAASTPTRESEPSKDDDSDCQSNMSSAKRKGSGSSLDMQRPGSRMRTENPASGLHEEVILEEPNYGTPKRDGRIPSFSEASDSAPSPRRIPSGYEPDPIDANAATTSAASAVPSTPYSLSYSSSFPSPRSPMSYDAHRISTTPSSIADENNYHSLLMGEPGPELVRVSVDVPSLTSSNSTMTRESTFMPSVRPRNMPFHEQRPASFTSAFGRRRSSLASLSRLISSAHGERSKLSMEVSCESEPEKKTKPSKSKRLSRMMQFWKTKEPTES
ncbi:hypothetical protein GGS23DRAFT_294148 [Durotheca rogersii]|uniref:uncharacterized protein n=1 Tax=Durotheca rogersii TaxID=419775 RepID=UPI00221E767E|nr:uncharacterized protein GGS23DRAFT_294148 [Durotheca rogersii]KAI5866893.1 hypothetical protein GGS23DRAFT_294148 [Durotheca rogersii]